jgi:hypothetical protein
MRKQHVAAYLALLVEVLGLHPDQKERMTDTGLLFSRTGTRLLIKTNQNQNLLIKAPSKSAH